jgi:hypothetical protein
MLLVLPSTGGVESDVSRVRRCSSSRVVILAGAQIVAHSSLSEGALCTREGRLFRAYALTHLRTPRGAGVKIAESSFCSRAPAYALLSLVSLPLWADKMIRE